MYLRNVYSFCAYFLSRGLGTCCKWVNLPSWSWNSNTLATWCEELTHWKILYSPDAGKDWRQEKGMTEYEMVGWHNWRDGHEFEQALGVGDRQGSLVCCTPWGRKEVDMTDDWTEMIFAWRIPRIEEHKGYSSWSLKELDMTELLTLHITAISFVSSYLLNSIKKTTFSNFY